MIINRLHEYIEDDGTILYEVDSSNLRCREAYLFFRKLRTRLGNIIILFNSLERLIEECILEMMNDRAEDSTVWILMLDLNIDKKIQKLYAIYIERIRLFHKNNDALLKKVKSYFDDLNAIRIKRNIYIHSNYLNSLDYKYFENKVKEVKHLHGYFRIRKKITIDDLDLLIRQIKKISYRLEILHDKINTYSE
jgi:hypothetical protein